jgi:DNA-binding transcriptional activator of the SARP family
MSSVQREHPEEYKIYKHLHVDSVIGVPFGPNPVGIFAIRNPTRYVKYDSALNVFAYVVHRAMAQQKTIDSSRLALAPEEIKTDKDIIVNFFGSMSIGTSKGVLTERELNAPKCSRVITYLLLNPKSSFHPLPIVSTLWPEEEDKWEATASYVRNYIHKFKKAFDLISPYPLIVHSGTGYGINPELNIMTDLKQFDLLIDEAQHTNLIPHKVELLKKAVALYKGPVFENADGELWIKPIATKYRLLYIGILNELLSTLDDVEDFAGVRQYAAKAVELVPENIRAHYWLLHAMNHLGTLELARNHVTHAKEILTAEEFATLKKYVTRDTTMPYTALLSDG